LLVRLAKIARAEMTGSAADRIGAAIRDGWVHRSPSRETRDALLAVDVDHLWTSLHLDSSASATGTAALAARLRRDLRAKRKMQAEAVKRQQAFRFSVDGLKAFQDPELGSAIDLLDRTLDLLVSEAGLGVSMLMSFSADVDDSSRPQAAARWRGEALSALLQRLRMRQPKARPWTLRRLTKLILNSSTDFRVPPCPVLVASYSGDEDALRETIKKQVDKAGKTRAVGARKNR
jgi:hypothetical protein